MKIWKISPWYKGSEWDIFFNDNIIFTGDFRVPELQDLRNYANKDEIKELLHQTGRDSNRGVLTQLWPFYENVNINDIIIAYSDAKIWGIGKIISNYFYDGNHTWQTQWCEINPPLDISSDQYLFGNPPNSYGVLNKQLTIIELNLNEWNYLLNNYSQIRLCLDQII